MSKVALEAFFPRSESSLLIYLLDLILSKIRVLGPFLAPVLGSSHGSALPGIFLASLQALGSTFSVFAVKINFSNLGLFYLLNGVDGALLCPAARS